MSAVLTDQNSLMEKIMKEYGPLIRGAVHKAMGGMPCVDDIMSEVHFAIFLTLRKVGDGWRPPKSFIYAIIRNKVNDFLRQKYRDAHGLEEIKRWQVEQASEREEAMTRVHALTHREFKVFRLLGLGLTNEEIAESLFISPLTVRSHLKKIHAKCGVKERVRLALTAYQACYQELSGSAEEREVRPSHDLGDYRRPEMHATLPAGFRAGLMPS